jgi:hypothetical protein
VSDVIDRADPVRDLGCWISSSRGRYVTSGLVWKAMEWGFPDVDDQDRRALEAYDRGDDELVVDGEICFAYEWVLDLADKAEDWLNEHVAPEGHHFDWHDCEFFLWTDEEWQTTCY